VCVNTLIVTDGIASDQAVIEQVLEGLLAGERGRVAEAMRYATLGEGQRLRPMLALRIARAVGDERSSLRAAGAVELLHCASLIVDDLPCMDDSATRRNRDAVHVRFGEATAVLAAFGLVALAARIVSEHQRFQTNLLRTLSCDSLIGGQALDLELAGAERLRESDHVAALKTVPLFVLAAEAGCLAPGVDAGTKQAATDFAREFGISYQMVDDFLDGETSDRGRVELQLARTRSALQAMTTQSEEVEEMLVYLNGKIWEDSRGRR
jgi:geranylgeranyl diphosphate synthase type II